MHYLSEFNMHGIADNSSIRIFITSVADQLTVPNSIIMISIGPLGKNSDGRSVKIDKIIIIVLREIK